MEREQKRPLINELTQGKELANQLKDHLDKTMSPQDCEFLVEKILSSYEKALSILNWRSALVEAPATPAEISSTPSSEEFYPTESQDQCNKNVCKKRKTMAKWSEQVKVCSGTMVEGPVSDGYSWRKYGQKDILGANYPRAYYRCTHRHVQGCLATKQVQRSDEDPLIFEITYRGRHTCIQAAQLSKALAAVGKKQKKEDRNIQEQQPAQQLYSNLEFGFQSSERVESSEEGIFHSFSFPSTPTDYESLENLFFLGCDAPSLITPTHYLQSSDSDLTELINSTPNSATNSPIMDWDFSLDHFNANFPF